MWAAFWWRDSAVENRVATNSDNDIFGRLYNFHNWLLSTNYNEVCENV